jgi:tetratricopeptide (TPR) repeat protein
MEEYRREIHLHAHAFKARFNLARMLEASGDKQGQIQELTAAVEENPDFTLGRFFLAKALLDAGDLKRAETEARKALDSAPDHYYAPLGQYVLADIYSRQGDTAAAEEAATRGRQLEARNLPPPLP